MFPSALDYDIYRKHNSDLQSLSDEELLSHYDKYGSFEGRISGNIKCRNSLIQHLQKILYDNKTCLEIGPFDNPVITGKNVKYFDVLTQEELKLRSIEHKRPHPIENIPYIDYVDPIGNLSIVKEHFDIVLSCHSIEHQLDFIQHLNNVSNILNKNGRYVVIVPDKRYCFDHFLPESTIADVLEQHKNKSKIHLLKSVIEHRALTCHNESARHWNGDHGEPKFYKNPEFIDQACIEYQRSVETQEYLDVHSLQFTPYSFRILIDLLYNMNLISLNVDKVYHTPRNSNEFYIILKKDEK